MNVMFLIFGTEISHNNGLIFHQVVYCLFFQTEEPCNSQEQWPASDCDGNVPNHDVSRSIKTGQFTGSGEGTGPVPWGGRHGWDTRPDHADPRDRGNKVSAQLLLFDP